MNYQLIQTTTPDKPSRYSANGKRISKEAYDLITQQARMYGQHDTFQTKSIELEGGIFKRKNYSSARWED